MVLGKWLSMQPKVMILDEPTRGIDVGAKAEIYRLMRDLAEQGCVVIMISSDMEEILNVSDRVAVMHEGEITGILNRELCNEKNIMDLAVGRASPAGAGAAADYGMRKELGISVLLLVLCGVTAALNPKFLSPVNLTNMANIVGLFGIFSIGLGLVIITGGIDLSVGSMFALGRCFARNGVARVALAVAGCRLLRCGGGHGSWVYSWQADNAACACSLSL